MIRSLFALCLLAALAAPSQAQTYTTPRLSVGATRTVPGDSSTRLRDLATSGGTEVLFVDANGDVRRRVLGVADIPSDFTRRSIAEAVPGAWSLSGVPYFPNGLRGNSTGWLLRNNANSQTLLNVSDAGQVSALGLVLPGSSTLPTSLTTLTLQGTQGSPVAGRAFIGDGSGWRLHFSSRSGGTTVDRATIYDSGTFETRGDLLPTLPYSGNVGYDNRKWLAFAGAEMRVETIVAQERIATIGGRLTVGNSNYLTRDLSGATTSPTLMCVKYNSFKLHVGGIELGSKLYMERLGQYEAFSVYDVVTPTVDPTLGDYCYTVSRNDDGSGQNAWQAGDGIIDTGKTGDGFIDMYAFRGLRASSEVGPAIQFNRRTSITHNGWSTYSAIGHLNGVCGNGAGVWGAVFGNCASGLHLQVDATSGIRMMDSGGTPYASWDMAGTLRSGVHASGYPNVLVTPSQVSLGLYGATPTIVLAGGTGDATLNGNLLLPSGGRVASTGNFILGGADGLRFERWAGTSVSDPRSIRWYNGATLTGVIGQDSNGGMRINSRSSGSNTGIRMALGAFSFGAIEPGLFMTWELGGGGEGVTNIVAQNAENAPGQTTIIQFVPVHGTSTGLIQSRIGIAANPWTHIYGSQFYSNGNAGFTGTTYDRNDTTGVAKCQNNWSGGILISTNCT